ncbi:MAG TPA: SDR family NAD(P)-dependent oxidoreductase [Steroidobacteraceae bacterium]|nr:SDR family NAD(P)-dependent oxidoreductase [Steroidobacteraceae bacterium]
MKDVSGKVAFITGGGSGIGLGIARALVEAGAKVALADLRPDHLSTARDAFASRGQSASVHTIHLDVTDRAAFAAAADETERVLGKVQILVNNAGVGIEGPFKEATYADWDFGLGVNLGGVINGLQTFLPRMRALGKGGHVVNTASLAALVTMPAYMVMYVASKAAVLALTEAIRGELGEENIGVTVLCPGPVRSNIHELVKNRPARFTQHAAFQAAAERLAQRVPSQLWMDAAEVGTLILKAIRENQLYVITHGEWRSAMVARHEAMLAATPEKLSPGLIESLRKPDEA